MAAIDFYTLTTGYDYNLRVSGSGLGFFANGWGKSVAVGSYQDTTFITDSNASQQGAQINNVKYRHPNSGELAGSVVIPLTGIPNYQATLNIRVTNTDAIRVESPTLYIYDRVNKNNPASGVTTKVAEIIHLSTSQAEAGSGDQSWATPGGSAVTLSISPSPGISGFYAGGGTGSTRSDTRHDWYVAISSSPNAIGAKTYGLWFEVEYI